MKPDDVGKFCASYGMSSDSSFQLNLANKWSVFYANNKSAVPTSLLRISAEPNSVTVPAFSDQSGPNTVTYALFTISTSNSSKGFYAIFLPGFCSFMGLEVDYTQVNFSDFEYWYQTPVSGCTYDGGGIISTSDNVGVAFTSIPLNEQKYSS